MAVQKSTGFTFRDKAAACVKGLLRGRNPIVEVALGGLACEGLPEAKRCEYSRTILESGLIVPMVWEEDGRRLVMWRLASPKFFGYFRDMPKAAFVRVSQAIIEEGGKTIFVFDG